MGIGARGLAGTFVAAIAAATLTLGAAAQADAAPVETIADGGFEATECPTSGDLGCFNPSWERTPGFQAYPCLSPPCADNAASGSGYLGLGGSPMVNSTEEDSVSQVVELPEGGAKNLTFALRAGTDDALGTGTLAVRADGNTLLTSTFAQAPATYETRTVDLHGYSGPTTISFAAVCSRPPAAVPVGCDSFFVDDVSLPIRRARLETTFGRTPPAETPRRRARFTFSSNHASAAFECRLDGEDLGTCTSPLRLTVDRGRHRLTVRSVVGERVEKSPARHRWRVTKRR